MSHFRQSQSSLFSPFDCKSLIIQKSNQRISVRLIADPRFPENAINLSREMLIAKADFCQIAINGPRKS